MSNPRLGVAVIGFGWMGQAHSRSYARIPSLFPDRTFEPELVVCADNMPERGEEAVRSFGFKESTTDWREAVARDDVDVVTVCSPNMLHVDMCVAAAEAGKAIFCEKPVGGTPEQTAIIEAAAREAGVITGVGYNYRWAPLVRYAKQLIDDGRLGEITNYRGRFFSMYGSDPLGLLSWRFEHDGAGYGVSTDILSHAVDMAHMLVGPIDRITGTKRTFITERPLPKPGGTHYDRGAPGDPTGPVTNEDYAACFAEFSNGAVGTFEASRNIVGPQSQMAFEVHGTKGALSWNLETMNEMKCSSSTKSSTTAIRLSTPESGTRSMATSFLAMPTRSATKTSRSSRGHEFLTAVASGVQHEPGFNEAIDYVSVQSALVKSWDSGSWEDVSSIRKG